MMQYSVMAGLIINVIYNLSQETGSTSSLYKIVILSKSCFVTDKQMLLLELTALGTLARHSKHLSL